MEETSFAIITVKADLILLEPGDSSRYQVLCSQTEYQKKNGELTISLFGLGDIGAAFTYSTDSIKANWPGMAGKSHDDQINMFPVKDIMNHLPENIKNLYIARALIEAAAIWLSR